jgi:16S rRNA C1402 N4-methylase RsmH
VFSDSVLVSQYGEEKHSRAITRRIVEQRKTASFVSTDQLVNLIHSMYPPKARERNRERRRGENASNFPFL